MNDKENSQPTSDERPSQRWPHQSWPDLQFSAMYCQVTEQMWRAMSRADLARWNQQLASRGLVEKLSHDLQLHTLPSLRIATKMELEAATSEAAEMKSVDQTPHEAIASWDEARKVLDSGPARSVMSSLVAIDQGEGSLPSATESTSPSSPVMAASPNLKAPTVSGAMLTGPGHVQAAGQASVIGQLSSATSSGAATDAASGLQTEVYLRLPLPGKRDAFVNDGMLYVRRQVLRGWVEHLTDGKCCPARVQGAEHHSSQCWVRDADVR